MLARLTGGARPSGPIREIGEKRFLREFLLPMLNPERDPFLAGDDCGVFSPPPGSLVCASTDRVPWDLTANKLGLMTRDDLGAYLAALNISDIAAMGAQPTGLLLNLAVPSDFDAGELLDIVVGAVTTCGDYGCKVLGGDLSDALEPSLSATAVGFVRGMPLLRRGASVGDHVFVSGPTGIAATAFRYFREAKPSGLRLSRAAEEELRLAICRPEPEVAAGLRLVAAQVRTTAMDNTDGLAQTLHELATSSAVRIAVDAQPLKLAKVTQRVADFLGEDPIALAMGPGADLCLVGTLDRSLDPGDFGLRAIGQVRSGEGLTISTAAGEAEVLPMGWNYFVPLGAEKSAGKP